MILLTDVLLLYPTKINKNSKISKLKKKIRDLFQGKPLVQNILKSKVDLPICSIVRQAAMGSYSWGYDSDFIDINHTWKTNHIYVRTLL